MTLSQNETKLRSSIIGVIYTLQTSNPTVSSDRNQGYIIGSRWINISTQIEYVCVTNEPGSAVWNSTGSGGGGGVSTHIDTVNPTASSDTTAGYVAGQLWVNTVLNTAFIAASVSTGAAVWIQLDNTGIQTTVHVASVAPTVSNDNTQGYVIGSVWFNTTNSSLYVATSVSTGAATWIIVAGSGGTTTAASVTATPSGNNTGTNVQTQLNNINTAIANVFFMGRLLSLAIIAETTINIYRPTNIRYVDTDTLNSIPVEAVATYPTIARKSPVVISLAVDASFPLNTTVVSSKPPTIIASYTTVAL